MTDDAGAFAARLTADLVDAGHVAGRNRRADVRYRATAVGIVKDEIERSE